jgi:hypothetical protein
MTLHGIEGLLFETHNWGKSVAFWKALGYELELETDHHSGRLQHPSGGAYIFIAERPLDHALQVIPGLSVASAAAFRPPPTGKVKKRFARQHWGRLQMLIADPDGLLLGIEAPVQATKKAPTKTRARRK